MKCGGCGNQNAYVWKKKGTKESCDRCGATFNGFPDVFFCQPYTDEHLASPDHPGPKFIASRREKAEWLKRCHLKENGDSHHGSSNFDKISHRHAMESLRKK